MVEFVKKSIKDIELKGKRVLLRVDFNVPVKDRVISDNLRIVAALPTIRYLLEKGAKLALVSHRGRPDGERKEAFSMDICAKGLEKELDRKVEFVPDVIGELVSKAVHSLKEGELLMLENVRFYKEEESKNDEVRLNFAKKLLEPFDLVVSDAFGTCHRKNASTYDVGLLKPMFAGFLVEKELYYLGEALKHPARPFVAIIGGSKTSDKLKVLEKLLPKVDRLLIGGAMSYTFYRSLGFQTGKSLVEENMTSYCKELLRHYEDKIVLPPDSLVAEGFDFKEMRALGELSIRDNKKMGLNEMGLDIGRQSLEIFSKTVMGAKTILWNGPMGIFEYKEATATLLLAKAIVSATKGGAVSIIGGGDSAAAIRQGGYDSEVSHVSTGGGASLEFLAGDELPGLKVLA